MTASPVSDLSVKSGAGLPSSTMRASKRRAVGVVRVSRVGDRSGEQFVSPKEQNERIRSACSRDGLTLVETIEELDVSGGASLVKRHGLRRAVEMVETGRADVVVVAYFDRLVRSLSVQAEVVERVERAGGAILAVDIGEVRADTASRWLSSMMLGLVADYHRRATSERTVDAKRRAIARGVPTFPNVPPGYKRRADGTLEPDRAADTIREAFALRADGATIADVRRFLADRGIARSYHGVQSLLRSRIYRGELRFGAMVNEHAHEPIIDAGTFRKVQRQSSPRGRRPKSDRLLSRLGVLRCASCGARMVIGTTRQGEKTYSFYRCPPVGDCRARVTIGADMVEEAVIDAVQDILDGVEGTASVDVNVANAREEAERTEAELDAAIRAFAGIENVQAANERLTTLRDARDAARANLDEIADLVLPALTVTARDWDDLTLDEQRGLTRAVLDRVEVAPGRGVGRITIHPRA